MAKVQPSPFSRNLEKVIQKREEQTSRVTAALGHLPQERIVCTLLSWMSIDEVERMLETLERSE